MPFYGAYRALVVNNKDPEERGRITVNCPKVFGEYESDWCLPCSPLSVNNGGTVLIPETGQVVMIMFEEGNEDKPLWIGALWTPSTTGLPSYEPDRFKQVVKTKKGHVIIIDDKEDTIKVTHQNGNEIAITKEDLYLKHNNGNECKVTPDECYLKHNNGNKLSLNAGGVQLTVSSGAGMQVTQGGAVDIKASKVNFTQM